MHSEQHGPVWVITLRAMIGIDDETLEELSAILPMAELRSKLAPLRVREERLVQGKILMCTEIRYHSMIWKDM